jgi:protein-S-isoprenylcysteine O-methyltransferase Ste14
MWPSLTLAMVAFYWTAVVAKAVDLGVRRRLSANPWPRASFERVLIAAWVLDIAVWLYVPAALRSGSTNAWVRPLATSVVLSATGTILGVVALAVSIVAWRQMGDAWRLGTNEDETTSLVSAGIFGLVRHPIYSAQALLLIGSVLMLPAPLYMLLLVVHLACIVAKVRIEEAYLRKTHGDAYGRYALRVGRFLPRVARPTAVASEGPR